MWVSCRKLCNKGELLILNSESYPVRLPLMVRIHMAHSSGSCQAKFVTLLICNWLSFCHLCDLAGLYRVKFNGVSLALTWIVEWEAQYPWWYHLQAELSRLACDVLCGLGRSSEPGVRQQKHARTMWQRDWWLDNDFTVYKPNPAAKCDMEHPKCVKKSIAAIILTALILPGSKCGHCQRTFSSL